MHYFFMTLGLLLQNKNISAFGVGRRIASCSCIICANRAHQKLRAITIQLNLKYPVHSHTSAILLWSIKWLILVRLISWRPKYPYTATMFFDFHWIPKLVSLDFLLIFWSFKLIWSPKYDVFKWLMNKPHNKCRFVIKSNHLILRNRCLV